jgi:hypothetical protein
MATMKATPMVRNRVCNCTQSTCMIILFCIKYKWTSGGQDIVSRQIVRHGGTVLQLTPEVPIDVVRRQLGHIRSTDPTCYFVVRHPYIYVALTNLFECRLHEEGRIAQILEPISNSTFDN